MMLPNFLIVGAAKAGTSSLYQYLKQHPDIFMPEIKETHFFSNVEHPLADSLPAYERLFAGHTTETAVGEASASYLSDPEAPYEIKRTLENVDIFILLRNPADRAFSHWRYQVNRGRETLSFEQALMAEPERMSSEAFRKSVPYKNAMSYFYRTRGLYYEQVRRYIEVFGRERVHVFLFEDFIAQPLVVCRSVFRILGVDPDFEPRIEVFNRQMTYRNRALHIVLNVFGPNWFTAVGAWLPTPLRIPLYQQARRLSRLNSRPAASERLDPALRQALMAGYKEDIARLETLLGCDLSVWYDPETGQGDKRLLQSESR